MTRSRPASKNWRVIAFTLAIGCSLIIQSGGAEADEALEAESSWKALNHDQMSLVLRDSLREFGVAPNQVDESTLQFLASVTEERSDPIDAFVRCLSSLSEPIQRLATLSQSDPIAAAATIDPSAAEYAELESLPKVMRMTVRTWLGRSLVRSRYYDEALPVIAEVDPKYSIDPASALFYRGACYHTLLMKKEALADLRALLENEDECPTRFSRMAKLMIADIKPLKEDSLDEISRIMTDVSRRLDLGRSGEKVEDQEQKIIDKLTKLIEKLEEQQQQQQQQQQGGGGGGGGSQEGGNASPMQDSRIAGASGQGNVQKKNQKFEDRWGNLPPAERKEALQKIGRDLPTYYRDAIEAYFRKRANDG